MQAPQENFVRNCRFYRNMDFISCILQFPEYAIEFQPYLLASDETVRREFGAYDNIRDNYPKYVVSLDEFDMSRNGIKHRNIRDFLLAEEWN